jgi:hypothetical protein
MVQIDVPVAFALGNVFADAAKKQLQTEDPKYYYKTFYRYLVYQIFFFSWIPVYFMINYFGWETTHMWWTKGSITDYPFFVPVFMVVFFIAVFSGFKFGTFLVRNERIWLNRFVYLGIGIFSGVWIFGQTNSTFKLGTYEQWKNGVAPWFYQDKTFLFMLIFTVLLWAAAMAIFLFKLGREGKRLNGNNDVL